jgi:polyisoprenoid-binding protein YceI
MGLFNRSKATAPADPGTAAPPRDLSHLTGDYSIDPAHSEVGFSVRHAMITTVRGSFDEFEGTLHLDGADPSRSSAEVSIKVASVDTRQQQRDEHLRTGDFFEADTYPEIRFRSTAVQRADPEDAENYRVTGDLTIKDVTKPVTFALEFNGEAKDPYGNLRVGFEGSAKVSRGDWGLTYNATLETGGVLIGDEIKLFLSLSAIRSG